MCSYVMLRLCYANSKIMLHNRSVRKSLEITRLFRDRSAYCVQWWHNERERGRLKFITVPSCNALAAKPPKSVSSKASLNVISVKYVTLAACGNLTSLRLLSLVPKCIACKMSCLTTRLSQNGKARLC